MAYCTQATLSAEYGAAELLQLTDRDHTGLIDAAVLGNACDDASALVDSYLRSGGYRTPMDPAPTILIRLSGQIARFYLWKNSASDEVRQRYNDALAFLRDVAAGRAALDAGMHGNAPAPAGVAVGASAARAGLSSFDWTAY